MQGLHQDRCNPAAARCVVRSVATGATGCQLPEGVRYADQGATARPPGVMTTSPAARPVAERLRPLYATAFIHSFVLWVNAVA